LSVYQDRWWAEATELEGGEPAGHAEIKMRVRLVEARAWETSAALLQAARNALGRSQGGGAPA
jgi:hypothetical protein